MHLSWQQRMMGTFAHCMAVLAVIVLPVDADSVPGLLAFCGGTTAKCVNPRHDTDCVRVSVCFLHAQDFPPLVSLNNGTFQAFGTVEQYKVFDRNRTSSNICVVPEAFEDGSVEIQIKTQNSGTTTISNSITLYANPGPEQHCYVVPEVYDSENILVHVEVDNDQTCFQEANISCHVTHSSANVKVAQPVAMRVKHNSFNVTGFERCFEYSALCYIGHEGYLPALCEVNIEESMRPQTPSVLKAELSMSNDLTVTLESKEYFCSEAGRFIVRVLNGSNATLATFESNVTEVEEINDTLVLPYKFSPVVTVQPGTALTVVLTAVDNTNGENFRNSSSTSSNVQWIKSSNGANGVAVVLVILGVAVVLVILVVALGITYKCHKLRAGKSRLLVAGERQNPTRITVTVCQELHPAKEAEDAGSASKLISGHSSATEGNGQEQAPLSVDEMDEESSGASKAEKSEDGGVYMRNRKEAKTAVNRYLDSATSPPSTYPSAGGGAIPGASESTDDHTCPQVTSNASEIENTTGTAELVVT